jgi:hypothetical protein
MIHLLTHQVAAPAALATLDAQLYRIFPVSTPSSMTLNERWRLYLVSDTPFSVGRAVRVSRHSFSMHNHPYRGIADKVRRRPSAQVRVQVPAYMKF